MATQIHSLHVRSAAHATADDTVRALVTAARSLGVGVHVERAIPSQVRVRAEGDDAALATFGRYLARVPELGTSPPPPRARRAGATARVFVRLFERLRISPP